MGKGLSNLFPFEEDSEPNFSSKKVPQLLHPSGYPSSPRPHPLRLHLAAKFWLMFSARFLLVEASTVVVVVVVIVVVAVVDQISRFAKTN